MKKPTNQKLNQCISFINNIIIKILNQPTKWVCSKLYKAKFQFD
jgi:hypothetical protein